MASVAFLVIQDVTAHAQNDSLEDAREICEDGTYFPNNLRTKEDCKRRQRYILAAIFAMIFCLLVLQGNSCWLYLNSNLIDLRTFELSSHLVFLNSKLAYIGLYIQVSLLLGMYQIICEIELLFPLYKIEHSKVEYIVIVR